MVIEKHIILMHRS
jgi:hypothetical protein